MLTGESALVATVAGYFLYAAARPIPVDVRRDIREHQ